MSAERMLHGSGHLFTVDVEEYFQVHAFEGHVEREQWSELPSRVERSTDDLLEMLDRHGTSATFFVLGWLAERNPGVVRRIASAGHEVASHGWSHRKVCELEAEEFRIEVRRSKTVLEEIIGRPVVGFRAPSFSVVPGCEWAFRILVEEGYRYDSSVFPVRHPDYGYPGAASGPYEVDTASGPLLELPLATLELGRMALPAAGGAYFRHLPYGLVRRALCQLGARGLPGVFYIHTWEVDPGQPRLPVSWLARLRHYRGLERTASRLERLLEEFSFGSVSRWLDLEEGPPDPAGSGSPVERARTVLRGEDDPRRPRPGGSGPRVPNTSDSSPVGECRAG